MVYIDNKDTDSHLEVKSVMDFIFLIRRGIRHLSKLFMFYSLFL